MTQQPPGWQQPPFQSCPRRVVSRRKMNPFEIAFHVFMTMCMAGLWGFVWWARVRARRTVTTYQ